MLYTESSGQGPDIALIHGWGLHSGIWAPVVEQLSRDFRVTLVDLPGHGRSPLPAGGFDLARMSQLILDSVPNQSIWVGWSIGGMAGLYAALHSPERVGKLSMVAAQPQFIQSDDWPYATPEKNLDTFTQNLTENAEETLKRFLGLQVRGTDDEKTLLKQVRNIVAERPLPNNEALRLGLKILKSTNLRPELNTLTVPTQVILGERDGMVPVATADNMKPLMPKARFDILAKAGHAPFLSHPADFISALTNFANS